jgi:CRP/FNR family cyclic AMP-dependent transcriptional regulator
MENRRLSSDPLSGELELLGDGKSFQDTICNMLLGAKGFEIFQQHELAYLSRHMKAYFVRAGTTIFHEGDGISYLFVLIQGRVCVYKEDSEHQNKLLSVISPGRIFGEISIVDNFPYSASVIAESNATFLLMSREDFRQCIDDKPVLGVRLLGLIARLLCARLRASSGQLVEHIDG